MMPIKKPRMSDSQRRARLRELMEQYSLTSAQVAELLEVHPVTVRRWRGRRVHIPRAYLHMLDSFCVGLN